MDNTLTKCENCFTVFNSERMLEKKMNKIKALLIAGMMGFTMIAHAVTVDPSAADTLYVSIDGAVVQTDPARFDTTGETFFNVIFDSVGTASAVGSSFDINFSTLSAEILPVEAYLYKDDTSGSVGTGTIGKFDESLDLLVASATGLSASFSAIIDGGQAYFLKLVGVSNAIYDVKIGAVSTVPVPAAGILFASALFGVGVFGRRKKKSSATLMVGAFARAS